MWRFHKNNPILCRNSRLIVAGGMSRRQLSRPSIHSWFVSSVKRLQQSSIGALNSPHPLPQIDTMVSSIADAIERMMSQYIMFEGAGACCISWGMGIYWVKDTLFGARGIKFEAVLAPCCGSEVAIGAVPWHSALCLRFFGRQIVVVPQICQLDHILAKC